MTVRGRKVIKVINRPCYSRQRIAARVALAGALTFGAATAGLLLPTQAGAANLGSTLDAGSTMDAGNYLSSPDGQYTFDLQASDGNLVEYQSANSSFSPTIASAVMWTVGGGLKSDWLTLTTDGDLQLWASVGGPADHQMLWHTGTTGADAVLEVEDSGEVRLYDASGTLWYENCESEGKCTPQAFADLVLQVIGAPQPEDPQNGFAIMNWEHFEGGGGGCSGSGWGSSPGGAANPLNTTQVVIGESYGAEYDYFNSDRVLNFLNGGGHGCWYWGIDSITYNLADTGYYPDILAVFKDATGKSTDMGQCDALSKQPELNTFGTGEFTCSNTYQSF
jgi:hypothetical protein